MFNYCVRISIMLLTLNFKDVTTKFNIFTKPFKKFRKIFFKSLQQLFSLEILREHFCCTVYQATYKQNSSFEQTIALRDVVLYLTFNKKIYNNNKL